MASRSRLALALAARAWRSSMSSLSCSEFVASCSGRGGGGASSTSSSFSTSTFAPASSKPPVSSSSSSSFPPLPPEYAPFYRNATLPVRRKVRRSRVTAEGAEAGKAQAVSGGNAGAGATPWMLPWERRQLLGDEKQGLRTWEKAYWGLFVTAIAFLLYSRLLKPDSAAEAAAAAAQVDAADAGKVARERAKEAAARPLLAGRGCFVLDDEDDPFEDLEPEEVQAFVEAMLKDEGASSEDPFAGLDAEEIDALVAKWGSEGGGGRPPE